MGIPVVTCHSQPARLNFGVGKVRISTYLGMEVWKKGKNESWKNCWNATLENNFGKPRWKTILENNVGIKGTKNAGECLVGSTFCARRARARRTQNVDPTRHSPALSRAAFQTSFPKTRSNLAPRPRFPAAISKAALQTRFPMAVSNVGVLPSLPSDPSGTCFKPGGFVCVSSRPFLDGHRTTPSPGGFLGGYPTTPLWAGASLNSHVPKTTILNMCPYLLKPSKIK